MFFVALAPASNLFIFCSSTMAERFLYLPSVAFAGLVGWVVAENFDRTPRLTCVVAGLLLLACAVRTYVRNEDWRDDLSFWLKLVDTSPGSYRPHAGLATALLIHDPEHRDTDAAVASVQRALALVPDAVAVQITAGQVYRVKGDTMTKRDAEGEMEQTPASAYWYQQSLTALQNAAALLTGELVAPNTGQPNAAINANESTIYDELGQTWLRLGNSVAAVESFRQARRTNPTRETVYLHLGDALAAAGQPAEAARSYWQALFIATDRAPAQKALTPLYVRDCPQLNASCPRIHDDICAAYAEMAELLAEAGQNDDARQAREHAAVDYHCPP
jgi:predicted Zn-dependent protease